MVALAATVAAAPSITQAACVGDCLNTGSVTVNDVIVMTNVALGTQQVSACTAGDADSNGHITVNEIVTGVNSSLHGCPPPGEPVCGNGVTDAGEECDDGGICIGGTNAGAACTKESDCVGEGVCDTFGTKGPPGTVSRKVCSNDNECGGAKCIHCKTFGGDGCAANCTHETEGTLALVPGVIEAGGIKAGTSGAVVHSDILTIPLGLTGTNKLVRGNERNGLIPTTQKVTGINLPRIPVGNIACACVRGAVYKTCGGTQFEADGQTQSVQCTDVCDEKGCTARDSLCEGKKPCTAIAGPGNSGEGVIGCESLPLVNYTVVQDAGGSGCPLDGKVCVDERYNLLNGMTIPCTLTDDCPPGGTCGCTNAKLPVFTAGGGGGAGSQILATSSAIAAVAGDGSCEGGSPPYGADGQLCTSDDPETSRGVATVTTLVSGTATAQTNRAGGNDDPNIATVGPFSATGNPLTCDKVTADMLTGAAQAGAFPALDQPTTEDEVVTNVFAIQ
jgi:hypothetical protein